MTPEQLKAVLDSSGIPFSYHHWETEKKPPFGVYLYIRDVNFHADGVVFFEAGHYQVELYTLRKDPAAEAKVEAALSRADIPYEKSEAYLESERLYEILYEIEV